MHTPNAFIVIAGLIFIALAIFAYIRSRQGDQRMIQTSNNLLLPLLSIIVITLGSIFRFQEGSPACMSGIPNTLRYLAVFGTILFIMVGVIRYILSQSKDRRLVIHPVLFAIMLVIVVFMIEHVSGCV
jgi:hypothetical protein